MPLVTEQDNLEFLMDTVPGYRERLEAEAGAVYPVKPIDMARLAELSRQRQRVNPVSETPFGGVGSARIPGNEFSIDTRGAAKGVSDIVDAVVNRSRSKKRSVIDEELTPLQNQHQVNVENTGKQQTFVSDGLAKYLEDEQQYLMDVKRDDNTHKNTLARDEKLHEYEKEIAEIENKDRGTTRITTGDLTNYRLSSQALIDTWADGIQSIDDEIARRFGDTPAAQKLYFETARGDEVTEYDALIKQRQGLVGKIETRQKDMDTFLRERAGVPATTSDNGWLNDIE